MSSLVLNHPVELTIAGKQIPTLAVDIQPDSKKEYSYTNFQITLKEPTKENRIKAYKFLAAHANIKKVRFSGPNQALLFSIRSDKLLLYTEDTLLVAMNNSVLGLNSIEDVINAVSVNKTSVSLS